MKRIIITTLFCLFIIISFAQIDENLSYSDLQTKAIDYYRANNMDSAILFMEFAYERFPDEDLRSTRTLGAFYAIAGQHSKAIKIWKYGIEKGYYYRLNSDRYKEAFKDNAEFAELAKIEKDKIDAAHIKYEVILPTNYDKHKLYPTLFIFHGNNRNIETSKQSWISEIMTDNYISIFVQSYVHMSLSSFQWIPNDEKTNNEFKEVYDNIMATYSVDTNKIIFSGMSAGGRKALEYAFSDFIPVSGLVLNCPVVPRDISEDAIKQFVEKNKRIGIITGENDFALVAQKKLLSDIEKFEGQNKLIVNKDLGHAFSEDFSSLLDEYLKWIIK